MIDSSSLADGARLLAASANPRAVPATDPTYRELLARYLDDVDFAAAVDSMAAGFGLHLTADPVAGLVAVAEPDSPVRVTVGDLLRRFAQDKRPLIGAVVLATAATAYPEPGQLDDPLARPTFTTDSVVSTMDRICDATLEDLPEDGPEEPDLVELARTWAATDENRHGQVRATESTKQGAVTRVLRNLLAARGLLDERDADAGLWVVRPRFRLAVIGLLEDSDLFAAVHDTVTGSTEDPSETGDEGTSPAGTANSGQAARSDDGTGT